MYRAIVKSKVKGTFRALSEGRSEALINQLADKFQYEFVGDHALGGVRTDIPAMEQWFERIDRLFGSLQFAPVHVEVGGLPWATTVLTEVDVTGEIGGQPYRNILFQRIELSFGKIRSIRTLEDTQHLVEVFDKAASSGFAEAHAAPITS